MARLPRLAIAGEVHLVLHRGHNGQAIFRDDQDCRMFLAELRDAHVREGVAVHAYALLPQYLWLLATPVESLGLSRLMQAAGRHYTRAFNRRYSRSGTVWDGRYRSTVVAGGPAVVDVLVFIEQSPVREGLVAQASDFEWSSARHHVAQSADGLITDSAAYWSLGNTPFDRAATYSGLLAEPVALDRVQQISSSVQRGWALASAADLTALQKRTSRPLVARRRGRPPSNGASI